MLEKFKCWNILHDNDLIENTLLETGLMLAVLSALALFALFIISVCDSDNEIAEQNKRKLQSDIEQYFKN